MSTNTQKEQLQFIIFDKTIEYQGKAKNRYRDYFKLAYKKKLSLEDIILFYHKNFPTSNQTEGWIQQQYLSINKLNLADINLNSKDNNYKDTANLDCFIDPSICHSQVNAQTKNKVDSIISDLILSVQNNNVNDTTDSNTVDMNDSNLESRFDSHSIDYNNYLVLGGDKLVIYIALEGQTNYKLIVISTKYTTYLELKRMITDKLGGCSLFYFYDFNGTRIDIDDIDSLNFFIQLVINNKSKSEIICKPLIFISQPMDLNSNETSYALQTSKNSINVSNNELSISNSNLVHNINVDEPNISQVDESPKIIHPIQKYKGHKGGVFSVAFAATGNYFVSCGKDKQIRVWNKVSQSSVILKNSNYIYLRCQFSPNSKYIAACSLMPQAEVWKADTGKLAHRFTGHESKVYDVKFDTAGTHLATASCDRTVRIWSMDAGKSVSKLEGHASMVFSCDFGSTDSRHVVSGGEDRAVRLWDWGTRTQVQALSQHSEAVWGVRYSQDDKYIASCGSDRRVIVWDVAMMRPLKIFTGHTSPVHDAIFSTDGRYIYSCGRDSRILRWPVHTSTDESDRFELYQGHSNTVYSLSYYQKPFEPPQLLSCSLDESILLWAPSV